MEVQFEEDMNMSSNTRSKKPKMSRLVQFLIKYKIAHTEKGANMILLVVAIIMGVLSISIYLSSSNLGNQTDVTYEIPEEALEYFPQDFIEKVQNQN
ncbi:MAG: hypothetical protein M3Q63_02470 [bacterium]|nr:hypothetical protein [bacterium]